VSGAPREATQSARDVAVVRHEVARLIVWQYDQTCCSVNSILLWMCGKATTRARAQRTMYPIC
jgi:hypothetical protein